MGTPGKGVLPSNNPHLTAFPIALRQETEALLSSRVCGEVPTLACGGRAPAARSSGVFSGGKIAGVAAVRIEQ